MKDRHEHIGHIPTCIPLILQIPVLMKRQLVFVLNPILWRKPEKEQYFQTHASPIMPPPPFSNRLKTVGPPSETMDQLIGSCSFKITSAKPNQTYGVNSNLGSGLRQSVGLEICSWVVDFKWINCFLVWDASLLVTVSSRQCLVMTIGKIENGLEHGFVKHRLNCLLITDPWWLFFCRLIPVLSRTLMED